MDIHPASDVAREAGVDLWERVPSRAEIEATITRLETNGFLPELVPDGAAALERLKALIPPGAEVMTGSSTTLAEIGFNAYLARGEHPWTSLVERVRAEGDPERRMELRRLAVTAEWFVASVNAITEEGELVAADRSGSRIGAFPYGAKNLVLVAGVQKIVPTLSEAMDRIRRYVYPLENVRAQRAYSTASAIAKVLILARETLGPRTTVILVEQPLGY